MARQGRLLVIGAIALAAIGWTVMDRVTPVEARGNAPATPEQLAGRADVEAGRLLVLSHACADCHGGSNPAAEGWLAGAPDSNFYFKIGPFTTVPRNLTPDNLTGLGRFTERQIFNALRYGLRPGETPDVTITSMTPGEGNFPEFPKYLAVPMPWPGFRHMTDQELWNIAAYLKRGLKPVSHKVPDSEGPPDFWASSYTVEAIGRWPAEAFPTAQERQP
jgi:mono/diheme cytochrome c family protein